MIKSKRRRRIPKLFSGKAPIGASSNIIPPSHSQRWALKASVCFSRLVRENISHSENFISSSMFIYLLFFRNFKFLGYFKTDAFFLNKKKMSAQNETSVPYVCDLLIMDLVSLGMRSMNIKCWKWFINFETGIIIKITNSWFEFLPSFWAAENSIWKIVENPPKEDKTPLLS